MAVLLGFGDGYLRGGICVTEPIAASSFTRLVAVTADFFYPKGLDCFSSVVFSANDMKILRMWSLEFRDSKLCSIVSCRGGMRFFRIERVSELELVKLIYLMARSTLDFFVGTFFIPIT